MRFQISDFRWATRRASHSAPYSRPGDISSRLLDATRSRLGAISSRLATTLCVFVLLVGCHGDKSSTPSASTQPAPAADLVRSAEKGPVKLSVRLDRAEATVPEPLKLTVAVESELGVDVTMPDLGEAFGPFAVSGSTDAEPVSNDFTTRRERTYTLDTILPGKVELPAVTVKFADRREKADGSNAVKEGEVATDTLPVTIHSGLADVKGPTTVPMPGWQRLLIWVAVIVAAMVAIALFARWWRRRRKQAAIELPKARRIVPHDWALAELDMLAAEDLVGRGRVREFYYRINWILRRYIELRFSLMAGEQTSEEFIRALRSSAVLDENHKELLRRFVAACDPVKYARHEPDSGEIDWVQASARDFVLETAEGVEERIKAKG